MVHKRVPLGNAAVAKKTAYGWILPIAVILAVLVALLANVSPVAAKVDGPGRGLEAASSRWVALGEYYAGLRMRSIDADTARWAALGEYYAGLKASSIDADTARWVALGEYFAARSGQRLFAANPELLLSRAYALGHAEGILASNPELLLSRAFAPGRASGATSLLACSPVVRDSLTLADNPELAYLGPTLAC